MRYLGIDIGTTAVKATVIERDGHVVSSVSVPYASGPGVSPDDILGAAAAAITPCADPGIEAVGLSGQTPSLVLLDASGRAMSPFLSWQMSITQQDDRRVEQINALAPEALGVELPWSMSHPLAKLQWLSQTHPEVSSATALALQPKDFVGHWLTGIASSDAWSSKGLCHAFSGAPAADLLGLVGFSPHIVPHIASPTAIRGALRRELAKQLGLRAGIPVAVGAADTVSAMIAVGAFGEPTTFVLSGTSLVAGRSGPDLSSQPGMFRLPADGPNGLDVVFGPSNVGGGTLTWFARTWRTTVEEILEAANDASLSDLPVVLPWPRGERAPYWRDDLVAAIEGLRDHHDFGDVAAATLLGFVCVTRGILQAAGDPEPADVVVAGPWANDTRWRRFLERALSTVTIRPFRHDASAHGAALIAVAAGDGSSLFELGRITPAADNSRTIAFDVEALARFQRFAARHLETNQ